MKRSVHSLVSWVPGPVRRRLRKVVNRIVHAETGMVTYSELSPDDIFICGYPKSGNTWFRNLVAGVVYGADAEWLPETITNDLCPDLDDDRYYRRYATPMYFKTHALPRPDFRRVVHLLRDGRDAMVSYFHHLSAIAGKEIDFLHAVKTGEGMPCKWHEHTQAWIANPHGAKIIAIKYEDLLSDGLTQMKRFCQFAGIERSDEFLSRAVEQAAFDKLRKKEIRDGWFDPGWHWPKDKMFIRRGQVGSFRDEMPPPVLEAFMAEAAATMERAGYSIH